MRRGHHPLAAESRPRPACTEAEAIEKAANRVVGRGHGGMPHMTCQNLHNFFADDLRVETDLLPDSAELAEHIASCPPCNRFVEGQKELKKHLHLLRDSPPIPASLDNAVVANYRSLVLERSCLVKSTPVTGRINPRGALGWAAAVAFAVVVAYGGMLLFIPRPRVWEDRQGTALQPMVPQRIANKETAREQKITRKARKSLAGSVKRQTDAASLAKRDNSFPTRFQKITRKAPKSLAGSVKRENDAASLAKRH